MPQAQQDTPPTDAPDVIGPGVPRPKPSLRARLIGWGRLLFAGALLTYVLTHVDWSQAAEYLGEVHVGWLGLFILTLPVANLAMAARWRVLLHANGYSPGYWRLFGLCAVGQFYNVIFPSTIGGDVARAMGLRKAIGETQAAFASTAVERLTGAAVMALFGAVTLAICWPKLWYMDQPVLGFSSGGFLNDGRVAALMVMGAILLITGVITATMMPGLTRWVKERLAWAGPLSRVVGKIESFQRAVSMYRHHRRALLAATGYAVLFQIMAILTVYTACRSLGAEVPILGVTLVTPMILLIMMLPLTPGGYGVVQWGYMVCFTAMALSSPATAGTLGVLISLLVSVRSAVLCTLGYAIYTAAEWHIDNSSARLSKLGDA